MDAGEDPGLAPGAKRALPLIGAALAIIVEAGLLYLRASGPRPPVIASSNGSIGGTALAMTSDGGANWTTVAVPQPV